MLRKLAVMAGWGGALFVVHAAFMMALFNPANVIIALIYVVALATTFPLHRATRGPLMLAVAFGLSWAVLAEGIAILVAMEEPHPKRAIFTILLALPFAALLVRRFATEPEDEWFRRYARRVVPLSLAVALPLFVAGAVGLANANPAPYDRARRVLLDRPFNESFLPWFAGVSDEPPCRFETVRSVKSGVDPAVRDEVLATCERFAKDDVRACRCLNDLLISSSLAQRKRRTDFRRLALLSAVPLGIALLFAWRGRRPARDAVSSHT